MLSETGNVSLACKTVEIDRATAYRHKKDDTEFSEAWEAATQDAADILEAEAWRRANEGVDEPVFYKGQVCGHVRRYSDLLIMFLLKGIRPEKYREKVMLSPGELDKLIEREFAKGRGEESNEGEARKEPETLVN